MWTVSDNFPKSKFSSLLLHCITDLHIMCHWVIHGCINDSVIFLLNRILIWGGGVVWSIWARFITTMYLTGQHVYFNSICHISPICEQTLCLDEKLSTGKLETYLKLEMEVDRIDAECLLTGLPRFDRMIFDLCISWPTILICAVIEQILVCGAESDWGVKEEGKK